MFKAGGGREVIQTRVCGPQVCCHFLFSHMQLQIGQKQMLLQGGQQLLLVAITGLCCSNSLFMCKDEDEIENESFHLF